VLVLGGVAVVRLDGEGEPGPGPAPVAEAGAQD